MERRHRSRGFRLRLVEWLFVILALVGEQQVNATVFDQAKFFESLCEVVKTAVTGVSKECLSETAFLLDQARQGSPWALKGESHAPLGI